MPKEQSKFITKTREQLYEMFMNSLKEDTLPWEKPWRGGAEMNPLNPISGTKYHGVNRMLLWMISDMRGIEDGRWATFNQIADKNNKYHPGQKWHLNAGSKGVPVELWKIRKVGTKELIDFTEYEKIVRNDPDQISNYTLYSQMFYVYNYSDISGTPEMKQEVSNTVTIPDLQAFCDEVLQNIGVEVIHQGNQAYYRPSEDKIYLPDISKFRTAEDYYATRLHETAHSTGAASRLNRDLSGIFGSESYAKEELRAEIGALFTETDLGIPLSGEHYEDHSDYLRSWIGVIQNDYNEFFRACADAEKISDRLVGNYAKKYELPFAEPAEIPTRDPAKDRQEPALTQKQL